MKFDATEDLTNDKCGGFVKIVDLGKAQQTTFSLRRIKAVMKVLEALEGMGFNTVTITVEEGYPIIIGGKENGIAVSPILEEY